MTIEQYEELNAKLRAEPGDTFAGCPVHVCVPKDSGLEICDLWESEEAMNKFATVMMPVAERMGLTATSAPRDHAGAPVRLPVAVARCGGPGLR
ncbi:hypothetical protein [Streptomyces peucetius]|uniref:ABM domain-containing protein n=1 Tax=Streptomyces peucetius TaxID=1950 RepID=A0ABY6I3L2_STRPE|nr:hypothetical protein [Streptomyces peucetius]UYQ61561.1 hypothetical protein OGH68_08775 [Streptomyces peucetius]